MHDLNSCAARDAGSLVLQPRGCVTSLLPKGPLLCARFKKSAMSQGVALAAATTVDGVAAGTVAAAGTAPAVSFGRSSVAHITSPQSRGC